MRRVWEMLKLVRKHLKFRDEATMEWTQTDADTLRNFLNSATGIKLRASLESSILQHTQQVVGNGGSEFECGAVTGMRTALVSFETLSTAGVAPQADQSYE